MSNFRINFEYPWLLLLLIPAIGLTLLTYFRLGKRYRCTRNRITSITLHITVMVLAIAVLAGTTFSYFKPNTENEVILLVDSSYSTSEDSGDEVNDFVKSVIDNSKSMFKLGIVTFGYTQVEAVPLTSDTRSIYSKYLTADLPDTTATNISDAVTYAASLFKKPETARIVLISDAVETDGAVANVIKSVAAKGIKVDTVCFHEDMVDTEVQIVDVKLPSDKILVGKKFSVDVTVESSYEGKIVLTPFDNDVAGLPVEVDLEEGLNTVTIPYNFALPGMHEMYFELEAGNDDTVSMNNTYLTYVYLEIYDDILIIESIAGESDALTGMLREELNVTVIDSADTERMPKSVNELRMYDEVILCNVSYADLPAGFDTMLKSYVSDFGGGLFTICGSTEDSNPGDENWTANAYTREDMYGTDYQEMLPVEVIDYTPPLAVIILVDTSGSMYNPGTKYEGSKLEAALLGARACLDVLSERDYVGVMTLATTYTEEIKLTPRTQRDKILGAIDTIEQNALDGITGGGTVFSEALKYAGQALAAMSDVENKHIIIVTDGEPSSSDAEDYQYWFQENAKKEITTSIVGIQCGTTAVNNMQNILVEYAGMTKDSFYRVNDIEKTPEIMKADLELPAITEVNYETFIPKVKDPNSLVMNGVDSSEMPSLDGFYGVKIKEGANVILTGKYTPIYAEWQFGKGMVGTFACDLTGDWSSEFIASSVGSTIINNILTSLAPRDKVKPSEIEAEWSGDNYNTQLSVFTDLAEGQYIEVTVKSPAIEGLADELIQNFRADASNGYSRIVFSVTRAGLHEITVTKRAEDGSYIDSTTIYKPIAYSKEYDMFVDYDAATELAAYLSETSGGEVITEPEEIFQNAAKYLNVVIDPKIVFMIIVIAFFLLDIAARKFKWKWPHEIVREKKLGYAKKK